MPGPRLRGAKRINCGSLVAVSQGKPARSSTRRNARRRSPSRPCQPRSATSRCSPLMDFTGYRKSAPTLPIFAAILIVVRPGLPVRTAVCPAPRWVPSVRIARLTGIGEHPFALLAPHRTYGVVARSSAADRGLAAAELDRLLFGRAAT